MTTVKSCCTCRTEKPATEFGKCVSNKDGLAKRCRDCERAYQAKYRAENSDRIRAIFQKCHRSEKRQKVKATYDKLYRENNRELCRNAGKSWRNRNPEKARLAVKARAKRLRQATPVWADTNAIYEFYRNCPPGYHVDHIIPLKGKTVCGLHVLENLQYLPAEENRRKGNRWGDAS